MRFIEGAKWQICLSRKIYPGFIFEKQSYSVRAFSVSDKGHSDAYRCIEISLASSAIRASLS